MMLLRHFKLEWVRRLSSALLVLALLSLLAVTGLTQEKLAPGENEQCPVCGMLVSQYPNWVAAVVLEDGGRRFFDGPKDLFRYLLDMPKYEKTATRDDIAEVYVTDYYTTESIPAAQAFFVLGSDVMGPMGKELVPLKDKAQAATFLEDHQGEKIVQFGEVTSSVLSGLQ